MTRRSLGFGLLLLAACGADNEVVPVDTGLLEPPPVGFASSSSSSGAASSSGAPTPPPPDAGASSGSTPPVVEAACDPNASFREYEDVLGIPADASWLRLTGDELHAFYVRPGAGTSHVFGADRAAVGAPFANEIEYGGSINAGAVTEPMPSDDGLSLRFTANGNEVRVVTRASLDASFGGTTTVLQAAHGFVSARDGSLELFSRFEKLSAFQPQQWIVRGQSPGTEEKRFLAAAAGGDAFASWYEPQSHQAWVARDDQTFTYSWDGSSWNQVGPTDFRVSWSSPNGCRLYGRYGGALKMHARIPTPSGADGG